jgi:hypothetical protein
MGTMICSRFFPEATPLYRSPSMRLRRAVHVKDNQPIMGLGQGWISWYTQKVWGESNGSNKTKKFRSTDPCFVCVQHATMCTPCVKKLYQPSKSYTHKNRKHAPVFYGFLGSPNQYYLPCAVPSQKNKTHCFHRHIFRRRLPGVKATDK